MSVPIDTETRGRLRRFQAQLVARYARLDRVLRDRAFIHLATELGLRTSRIGRQRAFDRLCRALLTTGVVLEGVRLDGANPLAVWSILKPREPVLVDPDDPGETQDCIAIDYVLAGRLPGRHAAADGLWSLAVMQHAVGRLLQRQAGVDAEAVIRAAHHAVLRLHQDDVMPNGWVKRDFRFLLPAGSGAFVCEVVTGRDVSLGEEPTFHVCARTWLHEDQLHADQALPIDDGNPGGRLGDGWLLPAPLRYIAIDDDNQARLITWAPGMPETLARPQGRA